MIIIISFHLEQEETFLVTAGGRNILGSQNAKRSTTCENIFGGCGLTHYKRNLAFLFRDTLGAKFQLWAMGCTWENRRSHLDLPKPGACVAVAMHRVWEGGIQAGLGVRLCPQWVLRVASLALRNESQTGWYFWLQRLLDDMVSSYPCPPFCFTKWLQPQGFPAQQCYLPPAMGNFPGTWITVLGHTFLLVTIFRQTMRATGICVFSRGTSQEHTTQTYTQRKRLFGFKK